MSLAPFFDLPAGPRFALRNLRVPGCLLDLPGAADSELLAVDLLIDKGRLAAIEAAGAMPETLGPDLRRSMVLPGMVDCHTHLDKGHIWPRKPNPSGDGIGAAHATGEDRVARWHAEDVSRRMEFGLMTAYAKGVVAIRTHLDSLAPQAHISFPVFKAMRERWAGRIELQASSIAPIDIFLTDEGRVLADLVADAGGQLGCVTRFRGRPNVPLPPEFDVAMTRLFSLATERGLNIDLHVDESSDPQVRTLLRVAEIARRLAFKGDILCGHCSSLALQTDEIIEATLQACVDARIDVVSLPTVNMYLQSRKPGSTPRWRGVTLLHEMKARGLRVAVAGDNCRDPFYAYGDHDMLDTFTQAVRILQLDHPVGDWIRTATATPADIMGLAGRGRLRCGAPADLLVLKARSYSELLARHQFDRVVLRNGRAIDTRLPEYSLLDDLMDA
jgi:cytosine deaminase